MEQRSFGGGFLKGKRIILILFWFQIAAFFLSIIFLLTTKTGARAFPLLFSLFTFIVLAVIGAILYYRFRKDPQVKRKYEHLSQLSTIKNNINAEESLIKKVNQNRDKISKEERALIDARNAKHNSILAECKTKLNNLQTQEQDERAVELKWIQDKHFNEGMVSTTLDKGKISGVGPKLKQRLIASGIRTANDVSYSRVLQVSGFGEAKARSVVNWSIDVERELKRTQPTKISLDKEEYISNKYQRARNAVIQEEQDEYEAIAVDLKSIQENAKIRHTENDENEMLAREKKEQLENQKAGKIKNLEPYSPLTYFNFIKYSLGLKAMPRELRGRIILLTIPGIILIGFLCQGLTLAGSIGAMLVDAIPTYTPTASLTPTVTLSPTPTNTLTYTITVTPSITPTYTITLTPSDTPTPTITYTPTITFTPTLTPTPTATIPSFSNINCIPQNTKREAALVTRIIDGDTIEVKIGEEIYPLRYIGIDTPEQGENFAVYAANRNGELVSWKWVTLVKDESETDRYDRLLRYVFFGDIFDSTAVTQAKQKR